MGTIIGMLILAFIAYLIKKNTGLPLHKWVASKYQTYLDYKEKKK